MVVPLVSWLVFITNPWHHLFFSEIAAGGQYALKVKYGFYFYAVHLPFSYGLMLISFFTILMEFSRASRYYRKQILLLLVSLCIPIFFNVLVVTKVLDNFTPLSFPVFFTLMAYAIFRHQFLGGNPIAYETVFKTIRDGVLILDRRDVTRDINPAAADGIGRKPSEIVGVHVREAFANWETAVALYDANPHELGEVEVALGEETRYFTVESTPLASSGGNFEGRIITVRDITDNHEHKLSLEALAFHDPLTRLANRRKFQEAAACAIKQSDESGASFAIIYFDLNRFKTVNDTLGHAGGDELLKHVAARVASILRKPDLLARLGGDEFALLLHDCDEDGVALVAERMLENVTRPFKVGEHTLVADLSFGVSVYPKHGRNLDELLRRADAEMYRAKQQSGGNSAMITQKIDSFAGMEM